MANDSSILTWKIPWTEEPGGLQSLGLQRVGHKVPHPMGKDLVLRMFSVLRSSQMETYPGSLVTTAYGQGSWSWQQYPSSDSCYLSLAFSFFLGLTF